MLEHIAEINYLAVLVAGLASFVLGMLWYGPLFGKQWLGYMGLPADHKPSKKGMGGRMLGGLISQLVMAWVLACFLILASMSGFGATMGLAFWIWLGFVATIGLGHVLWEKKPFGLYVLNMIYWLVGLLIMAGILGAWS